MNKLIMMLALVSSTVVLGQTSDITPRGVWAGWVDGSPVQFHNSTGQTVQDVLNQACPGLASLAPAVYQLNPNPSVEAPYMAMTNDFGKYVYPISTTITAFNTRICYHVSGLVSRSLVLVPVVKDMLTGQIFEGPGSIIWSGYYSITFSSQPQSLVSQMTLSGYDSDNLYNGRLWLGFRVKYLSPVPPEVVDSVAVKVHSLDYKTVFIQSPMVLSLGNPTIQYTTSSNFPGSSIRVTTSRPPPSSRQGGLVQVRCADGQFRQVLSWNQANIQDSDYVTTISIGYINNTACQSAPLVRFGTTAIRTQPRAPNGTPTGNQGTSNTVFLN